MPRDRKEGDNLTRRISQLREAIKRKYKEFRNGTLETERLLEKRYKPILKELRGSNTNDDSLKEEVKEEDEEEGEEPKEEDEEDEEDTFEPPGSSSRMPSFIDDGTSYETSGNPELTSFVSTPKGLDTASRYVEGTFQHPLTRQYMLASMKDLAGSKQTIDHTYGPRYEGSTLMIGDGKLSFDEDGAIIVNGESHRPTEGLYELIFKRIPDEDLYDDDDLKEYKKIITMTNAHKRGYKFNSAINRGNSLKYKRVIAHLFPKKSGSGGNKNVYVNKKKNASDRDILYWDDPNELVDRLQLLVMSAETGNTGHTSEIINIVEELKEASIISGNGNSKYRSLLQ